MLQSVGSQRIRHDLATEQEVILLDSIVNKILIKQF